MDDEPLDGIEEVAAELMHEELILRQEELCTQLGIGQDLLEVCLRWEIIHRSDTSPDGDALYSGETMERLCRGLRLHRDLGLNWPGVLCRFGFVGSTRRTRTSHA